MISVISVIIVFSILVIVHEFGHFIVAKRIGVRVEKFSIGFGPEIIGIKKGDTKYIISLIPLGGYVKLSGENPQDAKGDKEEYMSRKVNEKIGIVIAGPVLNYFLAFLIFSFVFMIGAPTLSSTIGKVMDDYPAESAGLMSGDKILKINEYNIYYWDDVTRVIRANNDSELRFLIDRDEKLLNIDVRPTREDLKTIFGTKKGIGVVGILPTDEITIAKHGIMESFYLGSKKLFTLSYLTLRAFWSIIIGEISFKDSIAGPVGISLIIGEATKMGLVYLLQIMAILSMSLAIFNVIPIPVLDGGHLVFLTIEAIRKKPVSYKVQDNITQIGFILLLVLMAFVFYNDFIRFEIFDKIKNLFSR